MPAPRRGALYRFGRRVRRRLFWVGLAFGLGAFTTWYYRVEIFAFLLAPAEGKLSPFPGGPPVFTAPTDLIGSTVHLAIKGGLFVALPVAVVSLFTLAQPAMPSRFRRFIIFALPATVASFVGGAAFAYFVMLPVSLRFLLRFGEGVAVPLITLAQYIDLLWSMVFWTGVIFELPIAMFLLAKMRIFSYRKFRRVRRYAIATAFFLGAILSPGFDPVPMLMLALPMTILYEVGLFLSWLARPEDDDYLRIKKAWSAVIWVVRRPAVVYGKTMELIARMTGVFR